MAEFDGMNTTTNTPSAVGGIGSTLATGSGGFDGTEDVKTKAIIVASIIASIVGLVGLITSIYKCYKKCRRCAGNVQQSSTPEDGIELNPMIANTGNDGRHPQEPASVRCVDEGNEQQSQTPEEPRESSPLIANTGNVQQPSTPEESTESSPLNADTGNGQQPSSSEERIGLNPLNADTGNGQQSPTPEEPRELSPLNADTENNGHPQQEPASSWSVDEAEISDRTLYDVARQVGYEWEHLAIYLGFISSHIWTFKANDPGNVNYQKFQMLVEWRRRQPTIGSQMEKLCAALARTDRNDIVAFLQRPTGFAPRTDLTNIQQLVMKYNKDITSNISAHPLDPSKTLDIEQFSELVLEQKLKGNKTTQEPIRLPEGRRNLDKVRTKPIDSSKGIYQVLVRKIRILLSGGAGFGKSTLLLRVANASTDPNSVVAKKFTLVFLVKLKQMQRTSCVLEAIRDQILPDIDKAVLKKLIDDNEADTAFLLDGLDEIPSDVLNSPVPEGGYGIKDILHNKFLKCSTVLVSTRAHMVDFVIEGYPRYTRLEISGFTLESAKKYITSYFGKTNVKEGKSLISHVTSNTLLRTLAQIPIMVLLLCIVWKNQSKLYNCLTALYTEFAEVLVSLRCNEGEGKVGWMNPVVCELGRVALNGLLDPKGERLVFSSEEFDEKDLDDGCRLGFLRRESFTSGARLMQIVTFLHKSIQEYCAANHFADLHHANEEKFHEKLEQINPSNVHAMEYLLRFACGILKDSPATGLILEHVQKQLDKKERCSEVKLNKLAHQLLFEAGC